MIFCDFLASSTTFPSSSTHPFPSRYSTAILALFETPLPRRKVAYFVVFAYSCTITSFPGFLFFLSGLTSADFPLDATFGGRFVLNRHSGPVVYFDLMTG